MVILNQSGRGLTDWSKIKRVISTKAAYNKEERERMGGFTCAVLGLQEGKDSIVLGTYGTEGQAMRAIGLLFNALSEGKPAFEFPQPEDLPVIKSHYGCGGGKSHGGS